MKKLILAVLVVACAFTISMGTSAQDAPEDAYDDGMLAGWNGPRQLLSSPISKRDRRRSESYRRMPTLPRTSDTRSTSPARRFLLLTLRQ